MLESSDNCVDPLAVSAVRPIVQGGGVVVGNIVRGIGRAATDLRSV